MDSNNRPKLSTGFLKRFSGGTAYKILPAVGFIFIFSAVGVYLINMSHAATPFASVEAESGSLSGGATATTDATASGGKSVTFNTTSTCNLGFMCNYPNQDNTGYENAPGYPGSLTTYSETANGSNCSGPIASDTTYKYCNFIGGLGVGSPSTSVSNVTFIGCDFDGNEVQNAMITLYGNNITFEYDSITPALSAPPATATQNYEYGMIADGGYYTHVGQLTVENTDIWGFGNAIDVTGSTQAEPQVYENNYIHDACVLNDTCPTAGNNYHTDGIGDLNTGDTDSYVVINHNTISSVGNTNAIAYQYGPYDHFTITNNYFSGFGYTIHVGSSGPTNSTFTGNVLGSDFNPYWGALYGGTWASSTDTWSNNTVHYVPGTTSYLFYNGGDESTGLITAANDGEYWLSDGTVSKTD